MYRDELIKRTRSIRVWLRLTRKNLLLPSCAMFSACAEARRENRRLTLVHRETVRLEAAAIRDADQATLALSEIRARIGRDRDRLAAEEARLQQLQDEETRLAALTTALSSSTTAAVSNDVEAYRVAALDVVRTRRELATHFGVPSAAALHSVDDDIDFLSTNVAVLLERTASAAPRVDSEVVSESVAGTSSTAPAHRAAVISEYNRFTALRSSLSALTPLDELLTSLCRECDHGEEHQPPPPPPPPHRSSSAVSVSVPNPSGRAEHESEQKHEREHRALCVVEVEDVTNCESP